MTVTVVNLVYEAGVYYFGLKVMKADFDYHKELQWESLPHFIFVGILCGWLASCWIWCYSQWLQIKSQAKVVFLKNRYFYVIFSTILIALLQFWNKPAWVGNKGL